MNQVVFRPAIPVSAVPVLPATVMPSIRAAVPVPSSTASFIIDADRPAVSGFIARSSRSGFERTITAAVRRDDPVDHLRLHHDAVVRDRGRHHRHLQRRHQQPLLAEREPAWIDLGVVRGSNSFVPL